MSDYQLRSIFIKIQDRLTAYDRSRFHFYLGNRIPRIVRDDTTLTGTLQAMNFLFEKDIINECDLTFLIDAFDKIQCIDAANLLRGDFSSSKIDS